jgi:hypothetical protein
LAAEYFHHYNKDLALKGAVSERNLYIKQAPNVYKSVLELMPLDKKKLYVKIRRMRSFGKIS